MSARYGVIGDPISHSLSPLIHNFWLKTHQIDATYEAIQVPEDAFEMAMQRFADEGFSGLNVTLPHKHHALKWSMSSSPLTGRIGAANTLIKQETGWHAENTDAPGFLFSLERFQADLKGKTIGVVGAGGSAKAIVDALNSAGANILIFNRTIARAQALAAAYAKADYAETGLTDLRSALAGLDIVVNTASFGYAGNSLELGDGDGRLFYDISYGQAAHASLVAARQTGWQTLDGLSMLVAQAAYSFEHWFGVLPEMDDILKICRQRVEAQT